MSIKNLKLNTETVRALTSHDLDAVHGGQAGTQGPRPAKNFEVGLNGYGCPVNDAVAEHYKANPGLLAANRAQLWPAQNDFPHCNE
jgi:hypothetical protein